MYTTITRNPDPEISHERAHFTRAFIGGLFRGCAWRRFWRRNLPGGVER
jgi:hypothetical protein